MTSSTSHPSSWISDNWEALKQKRLLDITLPGSHNSGNYAGGLLSTRLCRSDYRYTEYCDTTSCPGRPPKLSEAEFDKKFIPWNVNHSAPIHAQLYQDGIRWFHLKCCNFGEPGAREVNLHQVVFQHRGYTTHETLADALSTMMHFLNEHPQEILVLGLNNLHHDCPGARFEDSDSAALAVALTAALGGDMLIDETSLFSLSLAELVTSGKRLAIFIQGQPEFLPRTVISSSRALHEGWDDVMCSGDLPGCVQWLQEAVVPNPNLIELLPLEGPGPHTITARMEGQNPESRIHSCNRPLTYPPPGPDIQRSHPELSLSSTLSSGCCRAVRP